MTGLKALLGATAVGLVLAAAASAQPNPYAADPYAPSPYSQPRSAPVPAQGQAYSQNPLLRPDQVWAPAGTEVAVELAQPVGTHELKAGDTFAIRLAAPVIVNGQVLMAAGTPGVGRVIQSEGPGIGGKPAKLVLSADYLSVPGGAVPLQGFQVAAAGKNQSNTATLASAGGLIFMPLGFLGFAVKGGDVEIPAGTAGSAKFAQAVPLYPLARAGARDYAEVHAVFGGPEQQTRGWIDPPPPPPGMGQVVFFRSPSLMGTAQWFNVRENGAALGKLTNGAYFIAAVPPGMHHFTATEEPEFKDALNLKVDPGETYYVEGMLTKGVIVGAADLTPSDKAHFDAASAKLQPSPPPQEAAAGAPPPPP